MSSSDRAVDLEDVTGILDHFSETVTGDQAPTRRGDADGSAPAPAKRAVAKERSKSTSRTHVTANRAAPPPAPAGDSRPAVRPTAGRPHPRAHADELIDDFDGLLDDADEPPPETGAPGWERRDLGDDAAAIPSDAHPSGDAHEPLTAHEPPSGEPTVFTPAIPSADVPPVDVSEPPAGIKRSSYPRDAGSVDGGPDIADALRGRVRGGVRAAGLAAAAVACFAIGALFGQRDPAPEPPRAAEHAAHPARTGATPPARRGLERSSTPNRSTVSRAAARPAATRASSGPRSPRPTSALESSSPPAPAVPRQPTSPRLAPTTTSATPPAPVVRQRTSSGPSAPPERRRRDAAGSPAESEFSSEFGP